MVRWLSLLLLLILGGLPGVAFPADAEVGGMAARELKAEAQSGPSLNKVDVDTNRDGRPDRFEYYDQDVLVKLGIDSDFDGKVDEWQIMKAGKLEKAQKDMAGDVQPEKWVTY